MSLGEALGGISGEKFRGEKNDEKKVGKAVASAGDAYPGKEGFREEIPGMIQHAFAHPSDGRADCLRFASPAEALGSFEACRQKV